MSTEKKENQVVKRKATHSERFQSMVTKEFQANAGTLQVSEFQRRLIQNYFIKFDQTLKEAEEKRLATSENYRSNLAFTWENVNRQKLALDVVAHSMIGLDPLQPNHINLVAYKNNKTNQYDVGFIKGYNGLQIEAKKYGLEVPDDAIVELVYSTDKFKVVKRDFKNPVESYEFEITNEFDRGEIVGGFYYHIYLDAPRKNKVVLYTKAEIEKRKPAYASAEFWGGEKDVWKDGKKAGKEKIEGWYREMMEKTLKRSCWRDVVIDSERIDFAFKRAIDADFERTDDRVSTEISQKANAATLDIDHEDADYEDVDDESVNTTVENKLEAEAKPEPEDKPDPKPETKKEDPKPEAKKADKTGKEKGQQEPLF